MEEVFEFLNDSANKEKLYLVLSIIGSGMIFNTIRKVINEIKRRK